MRAQVISGRIRVGFTSRTGSNAHFLSADAGIMPRMDDTPVDQILTELEAADAADAPDLADSIAEALAHDLDADPEETDPAPPA
jgi:hypothetical protein